MFFPSEKMIPWLEKALDLSYQRHTVLSGNIANADTPEYTPKDLDFTDFLKSELKDSFSGPNPGPPHLEDRKNLQPTLNGNLVDVEKEMVQLTSNRYFYFLASEIMARNINGLRYAIDEGGR